jgi:hypothetical protein
MKYILTFTALFQILFMTGKSQNFEMGIKTGFGISRTQITNIDEVGVNSDFFKSIFSYNANGFLAYKSRSFWGFSMEPGIIRKGWNSETENVVSFHYIQLPVLSDFYLSERLFFSIGPEINYLLNAKSKLPSSTENVTEAFTKFELSGVTGITYQIIDDLDIGIRYSHGLTEMTDDLKWFGGEGQIVQMKNYSQYLQIFLKLKLTNFKQ